MADEFNQRPASEHESNAVISLQNINSRIRSRQRGVSMVELLVAMLLGLFLLYALVEILVNGKQSFGSASQMSRLQENGRIATNLIVTDLKRAGYLGGNSNFETVAGTAAPVTPDTTCATGNNTWGRMVEDPVFGINDSNAGYACISNADYLRGDVLTMRYTSPSIETGALQANRLYMRSSLFMARLFVGSAAGNPINDVSEKPVNVRQVQAYSYFVGDSKRTCGGDPVPSLFRVRLDDNGQPFTEELLPGVENLQVQYGDGQRYYDADDVAMNAWGTIITVRTWLLVRGECTESNFTDGRTYTMGDQVFTPNDNFRRQLYSNVVMIRN
jgi:type IV pilus assembly protein PilW